MKDFTQEKYKELLLNIKNKDIKVLCVNKFIENPVKQGVIIRHDVDRKAKNALITAKLEKELGFKTTYYFRITKGSFKPEIIKEISDMGHEIGYHYEDLSFAKGNYKKAIELFQKYLKKFDTLADVKTIAMHGKPLSKHDNRDIWKEYDFKEYGISGEAFLSIDYSDIYYFTDTGRSWAENSSNIRDKVKSDKKAKVNSTDDLMSFLNTDGLFAIVMHPERWSNNNPEHFFNKMKDTIINLAKKLIRMVR